MRKQKTDMNLRKVESLRKREVKHGQEPTLEVEWKRRVNTRITNWLSGQSDNDEVSRELRHLKIEICDHLASLTTRVSENFLASSKELVASGCDDIACALTAIDTLEDRNNYALTRNGDCPTEIRASVFRYWKVRSVDDSPYDASLASDFGIMRSSPVPSAD
jgi:hypothetical protein